MRILLLEAGRRGSDVRSCVKLKGRKQISRVRKVSAQRSALAPYLIVKRGEAHLDAARRLSADMLENQPTYEFLLSLRRLNFNVETRGADWGWTSLKATPTFHSVCKEIAMPQAQAAELAPVPYLREAAGLAVALFDMVQVESLLVCGTDAFHLPFEGYIREQISIQGLASDACELVYTATSVWKDREEDNDGKPLPQDLIDHLKELLKTMTDVMQFAKARASRGPFARFISHKADAGRIQGFRAQIKDAMDRFGVRVECSTSLQVATTPNALLTLDAVAYHRSRCCFSYSRAASRYSCCARGACSQQVQLMRHGSLIKSKLRPSTLIRAFPRPRTLHVIR
ncbi:hypothetical protein IMY05_C4928000200 [Salix suchowensis]|nr:hypothetical protein IMY05_C4928000200 [Salix suchowensis]